MLRLSHIVALALIAFAGWLPSLRADEPIKTFEVEKVADIAYYEGEGMDKIKHKLDLYLPKGEKNFPVMIFVHGGAWVQGDKDFLGVYGNLGKFYASRGIGVVVTNYRLSPNVKHPEHIKDVARAYAWTTKNIAKHGGNADAIFLSGHSAGGHLVSLLVTDESYVKAEGATLANVKGVMPISGVYILPEKLMPNVFGENQKNASPINHVRKGLPPFLIFYADADLKGCDKEPSEKFCKALKEMDVTASTKEITKSDHMRILMSALMKDADVSTAMLEFIRTQTSKK